MLLLAETDAIAEKICCKKYAVEFFCFGSGKIILVFLIEVIIDHVVIILINVKKVYLE